MTHLANMPDELAWSPEPVSLGSDLARELFARQQARALARVQAPPEPVKEPDQLLTAWRRPGVRQEHRVKRCKRFAIK